MMTFKEIRRLYDQTGQDVEQGRLLEALENLKILLKEAARTDAVFDWETLRENYHSLLKYAFEGYDDPQRESILANISASVLSMADEAFSTLMLRFLPFKREEKARLNTVFGSDPMVVSSRVDEFLMDRELGSIIEESEITPGEDAPAEKMENVFELIWLTGKTRDFHIALANRVNESETMSWPEKCQIVSALTLSLLDYYDARKLMLLIGFVNRKEPNVAQRALTGLLLAMIRYDTRAMKEPGLAERLCELAADDQIRTDAELILLQLLSARETEKITREFEQEVLPEMKKMMPKIEDKLQLGDLEADLDMDDKNPGWKDMIDDVPGLVEKLERFSRMQMEGSDVFMGTFSMLKRFDFFSPMSNWFLPFYKENPVLHASFPPDDPYHDRLFEGLEKAFYICNSDKYSFALNFAVLPAQQRSMIVSYFEAELNQMKEFASEEQLLDQSLVSNSVIIQYIQDLYRFFRLFHAKQEFTDPFRERIRFMDLSFYKSCFERKAFTEKLASWQFDKEHWEEAIPLYEYLIETSEPRSDLYQKTGYACQMAGLFNEAIGFYRKAELFDTDQSWILNKLGWCCMKTGALDEAVRYFRQALDLNPEDRKLKVQLAQCHIRKHEYEEALQIYLSLRYFMPDNLKILRPIAYCQFVLGLLKEAGETYREVMAGDGKKTLYDYMNAGHVSLCLGDRKQAIELYKLSVAGLTSPWSAFFQAFEEDAPWLLKNGIRPEEMPLLKDFLRYSFERSEP